MMTTPGHNESQVVYWSHKPALGDVAQQSAQAPGAAPPLPLDVRRISLGRPHPRIHLNFSGVHLMSLSEARLILPPLMPLLHSLAPLCVCVCVYVSVCMCVCPPSLFSIYLSSYVLTSQLSSSPTYCASCRWCLLARLSLHHPFAPTPVKEHTICRPHFRFPRPVSGLTTRPLISVRFRFDSLHLRTLLRTLDFLQFSSACALLQRPFAIVASPNHPVRWPTVPFVPVSRVRTSPANCNVRRSTLLRRL